MDLVLQMLNVAWMAQSNLGELTRQTSDAKISIFITIEKYMGAVGGNGRRGVLL